MCGGQEHEADRNDDHAHARKVVNREVIVELAVDTDLFNNDMINLTGPSGARDDEWLERPLIAAPAMNAHFAWFHTAEDEINHRGQIRWLRKRLANPHRDCQSWTN